VEQSRAFFEAYRRVNAYFAHMLAEILLPTDLVWVHDYHLIALAEALRKEGCRNRLGFFLHIPFPPPDVFRSCVDHEALMRALCRYDVVGFQTQNDFGNFVAYIRRVARGDVRADGTVTAFGRVLRAGVFPIGIYPDEIQQAAAKAVHAPTTTKLVRSLVGRMLMLGADRLDYSKGLDNRFLAYERLLEDNPDLRARVTFIQIAPPSRADVASYRQIRDALEGLAGHINGRFTEVDWVPLRYINKSFERNQLMGFLRAARVGVATPLRDGMNLVAKEYVAAQDPDSPGTLVLSEFAGAAAELDGAVVVNPYDVQSIADGMRLAITMAPGERKARWQSMMAVLRHQNLAAWRERFLAALSGEAQDVRRAAM
jgi:trehalose 6-phosphate synthase